MTSRRGVALLLALLVLVLVEAMTAGVLVLATHARVVASSQTRSMRAEAAADLAVASVLAKWPEAGFDTLPAGTTVTVAAGAGGAADEQVHASVERLTAATYIVRAEATVGSAVTMASARAVAIARTLDRAAVLAESNAAASSGGPLVVAGSANITAGLLTRPPAWADSLCPDTDPLPAPRSLLSADAAVIGDDASVFGPLAVDTLLAVADSVALGGVLWSELPGLADRTEGGAVLPAPQVQDGVCRTASAGNWGDPANPGAPCGTYFPLIYASADLTMLGGSGQGILAVAGSVTISAGATFVGLIVARDGVSIEPGAVVYGAIRSRSGAALIEGAQISYSRCAVARVAVRTRSAARLVLAQRRFIPAF